MAPTSPSGENADVSGGKKTCPSPLDEYVNIKGVRVVHICSILKAFNEHVKEHGGKPDNQLLLFTNFGIVKGTPRLGEEVDKEHAGPLEAGMTIVEEDIRRLAAATPNFKMSAPGSFLLLKDATIELYASPVPTTYHMGELVLFIDAIQAASIGIPRKAEA